MTSPGFCTNYANRFRCGHSYHKIVKGDTHEHHPWYKAKVASLIPGSGSYTAREEGVSHNLGSLAAGHIVIRPEARPVLWWYAWLIRSSTLVPSYVATRCQTLYERIEDMGGWYILKRLPRRRFNKARCVRDYF